MTLTANDNPFLVAPRPVRFVTGPLTVFSRPHPTRILPPSSDHLERVKTGDASDITELRLGSYSDSSSDRDVSSPRSSPRSVLPTEALEEFLSILRPSFFSPSSPVMRTRRGGSTSLPTFAHERSYSYKGRARLEQRSPFDGEGLEVIRSTQPSRNTCSTPDSSLGDEFDAYRTESSPVRWFTSNALSSPISRIHTRNPFLRNHSTQSPGPVSPLSPAAVPLPLPTPDEMIESF